MLTLVNVKDMTLAARVAIGDSLFMGSVFYTNESINGQVTRSVP